jgi:HSP20 family molecular chaperone IbpA
MVNRKSDHPFGLFGFPFFSGTQPQPYHFDVQDTENELIMEGKLEGFEKEHITIEAVRNGVVITAEKPAETKDGEGDEVPVQSHYTGKVERFIPVYFPFTESDISASFSEDKVLNVKVAKNKANRKFISIE